MSRPTQSIDPSRLRIRHEAIGRLLTFAGLGAAVLPITGLIVYQVRGRDIDLNPDLITHLSVAAIALGSIAAFALLLIGLLLWLPARAWGRHVREAASDRNSIVWADYGVSSMQQYRADEAARKRMMFWVIAACVMSPGIIVAVMFASEGDGGGTVFGLGFAALAALCVLGCALFARGGTRASNTGDGLAIIGDHGVFLDGAYWPYHTFGWRITGADLEPAERERTYDRIRMTFFSSAGKYSGEQTHYVPVPEGRSTEAADVVERLNGRATGDA